MTCFVTIWPLFFQCDHMTYIYIVSVWPYDLYCHHMTYIFSVWSYDLHIYCVSVTIWPILSSYNLYCVIVTKIKKKIKINKNKSSFKINRYYCRMHSIKTYKCIWFKISYNLYEIPIINNLPQDQLQAAIAQNRHGYIDVVKQIQSPSWPSPNRHLSSCAQIHCK